MPCHVYLCARWPFAIELGTNLPPRDFGRVVTGTYSYGRLTVTNQSHLRWQVVLAEENRVVDDVALVVHKHGPWGMAWRK